LIISAVDGVSGRTNTKYAPRKLFPPKCEAALHYLSPLALFAREHTSKNRKVKHVHILLEHYKRILQKPTYANLTCTFDISAFHQTRKQLNTVNNTG